MISRAPRAAPIAAGTAAAVNMKERDWTRRKSITSAGPAMKPPHEASDFENVPMRRSTSLLDVQQLAGARAASAEHAHAVGLVDHQACSVLPAERHDVRQRGEVALHREDAVDHHEHAAAVALGALQHRLELVEPVVPEGADARP